MYFAGVRSSNGQLLAAAKSAVEDSRRMAVRSETMAVDATAVVLRACAATALAVERLRRLRILELA
jgi:hypothetical protein